MHRAYSAVRMTRGTLLGSRIYGQSPKISSSPSRRPCHLHKVSLDIFARGGSHRATANWSGASDIQIFQLWPCACLLTWPVAMRGIYLRSRYSFLTAGSTWVPAFCRSGPHCPMEVYIYDTSRTCMSCCGQGIEGPPSLRVALSFVYSKVFSSDFYGFYF